MYCSRRAKCVASTDIPGHVCSSTCEYSWQFNTIRRALEALRTTVMRDKNGSKRQVYAEEGGGSTGSSQLAVCRGQEGEYLSNDIPGATLVLVYGICARI